jgi:hypothetical protein
MTGPLRRAWERFASGAISSQKMREFVRFLGHHDSELIDAALDLSLEDASEMTTGQLRARLARVVMELDPDGARAGMEEGLADRRVIASSNPDFTGSLAIQSGDPSRIRQAMANIERLARGLKTAGENRSLDEIRADVALDLLAGQCLCGSDETPKGTVHLTVDVATLAEMVQTPGDLAGYTPIVAELARKVALRQIDGEWTYTVSDNGHPVATGTVGRRPTRAQRRHLHALYPTCVFPGCRMPAYGCDLDHRRPHSRGGPTYNDNLGPLCRHHHMARHHSPWLLERLPDGDHRWTSPLGHRYLSKRGPPE